jgi:hypothetical protein
MAIDFPYNLRAVLQPELDVHGVAGKAEVYNLEADPKVIEEGFTAACELIYYLVADGYKIKTPLFNLRIRLPGEYEGAETGLNEGLHPEGSLPGLGRDPSQVLGKDPSQVLGRDPSQP